MNNNNNEKYMINDYKVYKFKNVPKNIGKTYTRVKYATILQEDLIQRFITYFYFFIVYDYK